MNSMKEWLGELFGRQERDIRQAQFSGHQYPGRRDELESTVRAAIREGRAGSEGTIRGSIAPYGDYDLAAPMMGEAWAPLAGADGIERVLLIGSSGRVPFRGLAVARFDGMRSPLGVVDVDLAAVGTLLESDVVRPIEAAFEPAANLELQIPFLQFALGGVEIIPVLVGDADPADVAELIEQLDDGRTSVVVAANLSEGHARNEASDIDNETVQSIEALEADGVGRRKTTGRLPIQAVIGWATRHGLEIRCRARATSADGGGPSRQVVGYGAFEIADGA